MRLLILLISAFLTALTGAGSVAHAAGGSRVVASAAEAQPAGDESVLLLPGGRPQEIPRATAGYGTPFPVAAQRHASLFADRLRL